jgi:hypothetical protein
MVANDIIIRSQGDAGLTWKAGTIPRLTMRDDPIMNWLKLCSAQLSAELSFQKLMRRCQMGRSPLANAYQPFGRLSSASTDACLDLRVSYWTIGFTCFAFDRLFAADRGFALARALLLDSHRRQQHGPSAPRWGYALQYKAGSHHVAAARAFDDPCRNLLCILAHQALDSDRHLVARAARLA